MSKIFALIDCNAFYCSCEQLFRPALKGKPVVVLSNNDGCAVARTQEAKDLGITMGMPAFMIRRDPVMKKAILYSSNYALYGDMSNRVVEVVKEFAPHLEVYSIDEMFLALDGLPVNEIIPYCQDLRHTVHQWTGIPTGIGVGSTKTLAKIANHIAKKRKSYDSVCSLIDDTERNALLPTIEVGDIWGIGKATAAKLEAMGIYTAAQLRDMSVKRARQCGTVVLEKIIHELNGLSCMPLEDIAPPRKGMACTRSFGQVVTSFEGLSQAVSSYATRAGEKLRRHELVAGHISVFIHTNRHRETTQYYKSASLALEPMTQDTRQLIEHALHILKTIYKDGIEYGKAGIILNDLRPQADAPSSLFFTPKPQSAALMKAIDTINATHGRQSIQFASNGIDTSWSLRAQHKSQCYTTRLEDVPQVIA